MVHPPSGRAACLALALLACGGPQPRRPGGAASAPPPRVSREYQVLDETLRNPERGLVQFVDFTDERDVAFVAGLGISLANARIRLDAFRDRPLDPAFLASLDAGFDRIRRAGLKLVLRFQYNVGSGKDPALAQVLFHIEQLTPVLRRNADVIAVMQAGFIGAWGEWHDSASDLTDTEARSMILSRLLAALPPSRSIQVRSPAYKEELFPGGPATPARAHDGSPASRIGHHNDCFLSSSSDHGTYPAPAERWRDYLAADSAFVPVGGESCLLNPPLTDCDNALRELRRFHWSYLNRSYHPRVIRAWTTQGCMERIARDLGYRLVLRRASWPGAARAGAEIEVSLEIENLGYAAPFNPRQVFLVIGDGLLRSPIELPGVDVRDWIPGRVHRLTARVEVPPDLESGSYPVALWLPDSAPVLRRWPAYAIRFSNRGTWRASDGDNLLGELAVTGE